MTSRSKPSKVMQRLAQTDLPIPADERDDTGTALCTPLPPDLNYVDDSQPGLSRRKLRGKWAYFTPAGERIRDQAEVERINKLAIPPAYTDVWICPDANGHLQATGRDARGRKQYRYHPRWREIRDTDKYERMLAFGQALPKLRQRVEEDLARRGLCREKVMATVISLLDATLIRVGNAQYAKSNKSYGLTTLRNRHAEVHGNTIAFHFRGKSGVEHDIKVSDPRLARTVKKCLELPGQHLFQYVDGDGERHTVTSSDVNAYLHELTGADFTAKDYRTWAGSALALEALRELRCETQTDAKKELVDMVKAVSRTLGNTPAVCRTCYIHPGVLDAFLAGDLCTLPKPRKRKGLKEEEVLLLNFLQRLEERMAETQAA